MSWESAILERMLHHSLTIFQGFSLKFSASLLERENGDCFLASRYTIDVEGLQEIRVNL